MSPGTIHAVLVSAFDWVLKTSLAASVLIALVAVIQVIFQKFLTARWRYALWALVIVRLLLPGAPPSKFSILNLGAWQVRLPAPHSSIAVLPTPERSEGPEAPLHPIGGEAQTPVLALQGKAKQSFASVTEWASLLWLLGVVGYSLKVILQHHRFASRLRPRESAASPRVAAILEKAKQALHVKQQVRVILREERQSPAVFGCLRPAIVLSKETLEQLSDEELRLILLHELVHIQRRDVFLNWLLIVLQSLHWFNPLVWFAARRLRADRELVCDAEVMRHLTGDQRHTYGSTLIKMLGSQISPVPSLVPILKHKREIHRRITMIAHFKPTRRIVTAASGCLLLTLGCLTFTNAAEKPIVTPAEVPKNANELTKEREAHQRGLQILEEELAKQNHAIESKQRELDDLKLKFNINDRESAGPIANSPAPDRVRPLESLRFEAQGDFLAIETLFNYLTNLPLADFKKAILTVVPDPPLAELINAQARTEQELARLLEGRGPNHPEVKETRKVAETIARQIDERLQGILLGIKAKCQASKAKLEGLDAALEKERKLDAQKSMDRRPYDQAKRDLENLNYIA